MRLKLSFRLPSRVLSLALALLVLCGSSASFARPMPQTPQGARPPFPAARYVPSRDYDTRDISLNLRFDWDKEQAIGTETFSFSPLVKDLRKLVLDAAYMTFSSIKLANGTPLQYQFDDKNEKLSITLDRAYQPSETVTLMIAYHTDQPPPERRSINGGGGLTWIKPTPEEPKRPRQIWSQGESEYNHYWFACFDHPNDFFTSEIYATADKPLTVISNGKLLETKENTDGTRTFHWKIAAPHASYLSSIIVGEYTPVMGEYAGIPVMSNVYPSEFEEGKVTTARLPDMVKFFSEKTGVKYPYEKYAQTMTRDFNGGMENISATTQYDVMIHDARTEIDQTSDSLESHELAHQWFGDYVTCRDWSDIWLNESFATYFQAMWDEHSLGHDDFLYLDVKANQDQYYGAWAQGLRRPIVTKNYANPDAVFDTYAYPRGGAVLHMLRTYLGEENWWRSINHYLNKYAHQPVQTEQFRIAIEETTGQSMDWFFDEWVYKMGHPVFRVTQNYDAAAKALKLTVRQEQKPDPDSQYPQVGFFQTPVDIEIGTAANTRVERVQLEPKEEQTFTFPVDSQPMLVNFDYNGTLIKELKFEKPADQLAYQLSHDQDVLGRVWALGQLNAKLKDSATTAADKTQIVSQLASALTNDKFWGVRLDAALALNNMPGDAAARTALLAATKDQKSRVRARALRSLASTKDAALASTYQSFLNDQSYAVIAEAARGLGMTKSPTAYDALVKLIDTPSWHDNIRASALAGLGAAGDKRAMELGFRYVTPGNPAPVRAAALTLIGATGKGDPRAFPLVTEMLRQGADKGNFGQVAAASEALVSLGDQRGLAVFEELGKKFNNVPQAQAFIQQFMQRLRQSGQPSAPNQ
ncbi:MAG TPA: M1 family aminopeptidase [Pyrinomonadaceae bacterium]|nr:M1 family aminopeptidase [Pyrinomonadaceae bacterium]